MDQTYSPEKAPQHANHQLQPHARSPGDENEEANRLPNGTRDHTQQHSESGSGSGHGPGLGGGPERKDTSSSITTIATTVATQSSTGTSTTYSLEPSPISASQPAFNPQFSISNGIPDSPRRPASSSRRRTGPLTTEQRKKASLIRKMGACESCKKRRVGCDPSHKASSWERLAALEENNHNLSPTFPASTSSFTQDNEMMEVDSPTSQHHQHQQAGFDAPPSLGRTPLPSSPRLQRPGNMITLPGHEGFRADLQGSASRIAANPLRSRYAQVSVLMTRWQDDQDDTAKNAIQDLADVFKGDYNYMVEIATIPSSCEGKNNPALWLASKVNQFLSRDNQRDILKMFYYSGHSYLGADRDTILASSSSSSSQEPNPESSIPWQGIQQLFEISYTDSLLILDCAYYPMYQKIRQKGMMELLAASAGKDPVELLGRGSFTHILAEQLRGRAVQEFRDPFTAAGLHAKLLSEYAKFAPRQEPNKEVTTTFPTPIFLQQSSNKLLPSIPLVPLQAGAGSAAAAPTSFTAVNTPDSPTGGPNIRFTFTISDNTFNLDAWSEWLRAMPPGIKHVKVEGPYQNTFR